MGGENVAASEIERVVAAVPGVHECAVVARKHRMLDEVPVVFVIAAANAPADLATRVNAACAQSLADFKRPREVRLVDSMPRSTLEKVAKAQLRAALAAEGAAGLSRPLSSAWTTGRCRPGRPAAAPCRRRHPHRRGWWPSTVHRA